jgi:hypothetical protein
MKPVVIALSGSLMSLGLTISAAGAADPVPGHSFAAKRQFASQVISCMRKRMATDKSISYNQAARVCKDEVTKQLDNSETGPLVAADTKN